MDPVEIDIRMKQNVDTESEKAVKGVDNIAASSKTAVEAAKAAVAEQKEVIKQIQMDMASIEKQLSKAAPGNAKDDLVRELQAAKQALNEEKAALGDYSEKVDQAAMANNRLRTQVMEAKDALAKMEMAGKRGTPEYAAQAKVLGDLNNQMQDTNQQAKILADDQRGFKAVSGAVNILTGAMTAGVGVAAALGAKDEDLTKIQTRLQAVMAITLGIQQVANALNKDEYFNVVLLTKAKEMWAVANLKVAATLGITTVQAQILMATLTLGLSVAITAIVAGISILVSKQQEAAAEAKKFGDKMAENAAKPIAEIKKLSNEWNSLGNNMQQKQAYVDKNKEAFKSLGIEINNVAEAESLLSDPAHLKAFQDAMMAKAKSAAAMELATEKYKEAFKKQNEVNNMPDKVEVSTGTQSGTNFYGGDVKFKKVDNQSKKDRQLEVDDIFKEGDKFFKTVQEQDKITAEKLKESGATIVDTVVAGSLAAIDAAIKLKKDALEKVTNKSDYDKIDAEIKVLEKKREAITGPKKNTKEAYNAEKEIQKLILDINSQTNNLLISQQEDSLQKRLAQIESDKQAEIRKITEKETAIIEAYNKSHKGEKGFVPAGKVSDISQYQASVLDNKKTAINSAYDQQAVVETKKYGDEVQAQIMEYAEARVKIQYDFDKKIKAAAQEGNILYAAELQIEKQKQISAISAGLIEETDLYKYASDEKLQLTKEMNAKLIAETKKKIEADKTLTPEDKNKLLVGIDQADATRANNAIDGIIKSWKGLKKAKEDVATATAKGDVEGAAKATTDVKTFSSSLEKYGNEVLNYYDQVSTGVLGIMDQLGMFTEDEKKSADQIVGMVSGAGDLAVGIATGNIGQIISGGLKLVTNAIEFFDFKTKEIEKKQKEQKKNLEDLTKAYSELQRSIDKSLGTDVYKNQKAAIENQKQQISDYEKWIELEQQKKKKKQDAAGIADAQAKIKELQNNIADEVQAITESLAQTNAKDLAGKLAEALVSAFQTGEDAAVAMGNVVNDVLKNAVVNSLKLKFLEQPLNDAVNYLGTAMGDGQLSDAEKKVFGSMVTAAGQNFNEAMAAYSDILGGDAASRTGASKGIATASQDSIDELTGGVYALRSGVADIRNFNREQLMIQRTMSSQLNEIIYNTSFLQDIAQDISEIKIKGINVKV